MKYFLIFLFTVLNSSAFGMEHLTVFWEKFTERSCRKAQAAAHARVQEQFKSGSDVYAGQLTEFHGRKIVRFLENSQGCEPRWSESLGMIHRYSLEVQVKAE